MYFCLTFKCAACQNCSFIKPIDFQPFTSLTISGPVVMDANLSNARRCEFGHVKKQNQESDAKKVDEGDAF